MQKPDFTAPNGVNTTVQMGPDLESDDRDYIKVKTSGDDDALIEFTNKAGKEYNLEFIDNNEVTFLR